MDWDTTRNAIHEAITKASGLPAEKILWAWQNIDAPALDYISIALGSTITIGQDFIQTSTDADRPNGQEIALSVEGVREVSLEIHCFSTSTADKNDALARAERTRTGLLLPSVRFLLNKVGVSPFDQGSVKYLPEIANAGFRGRGIATVRCYMPAPTVVEYAGYIAHVTGTITSTGGANPSPDIRTFEAP